MEQEIHGGEIPPMQYPQLMQSPQYMQLPPMQQPPMPPPMQQPYMQPPMQQPYMQQQPIQPSYMPLPMQPPYDQPPHMQSFEIDHPSSNSSNNTTKITIKTAKQKKNEKLAIWLPVVIAITLIIIVCCILFIKPSKPGKFEPMSKCTTCNKGHDGGTITCQSATDHGTHCVWCRKQTDGYNLKANPPPCIYGKGSKVATGKWITHAWDVHSKKHRTKKHATYKTVNAYKIWSVNHPKDFANSKGICATLNAKCKNCTGANPLNQVCPNQYQ